MKTIRAIIILLLLSACTPEENVTDDTDYQCIIIPQAVNSDRVEIIKKHDVEIVEGLASANAPNENGAMGRNKTAYFHVRFQLGISAIADYAVFREDISALEFTFKALEYAFAYQLEGGDFELQIPSNLDGSALKPQDLASGTAFFLSSAGLALNTLNESHWFNSAAIISYQERLELLRPKIQLAADWLLSQNSLLEISDQNAPNRLFFDALAYYSLGKWLNDPTLKEEGLKFVQLGMNKKTTEGYFLEADGWDSSYQGVANRVGFDIFSILDDGLSIKQELWDCLSCSADWQKSRVSESGEISTEDNTRVFPGGEAFLGQEKFVDWKQSMSSFFMMHYYSGDGEYYDLANAVKNFYQ